VGRAGAANQGAKPTDSSAKTGGDLEKRQVTWSGEWDDNLTGYVAGRERKKERGSSKERHQQSGSARRVRRTDWTVRAQQRQRDVSDAGARMKGRECEDGRGVTNTRKKWTL